MGGIDINYNLNLEYDISYYIFRAADDAIDDLRDYDGILKVKYRSDYERVYVYIKPETPCGKLYRIASDVHRVFRNRGLEIAPFQFEHEDTTPYFSSGEVRRNDKIDLGGKRK